jgi:hypothetical protein
MPEILNQVGPETGSLRSGVDIEKFSLAIHTQNGLGIIHSQPIQHEGVIPQNRLGTAAIDDQLLNGMAGLGTHFTLAHVQVVAHNQNHLETIAPGFISRSGIFCAHGYSPVS